LETHSKGGTKLQLKANVEGVGEKGHWVGLFSGPGVFPTMQNPDQKKRINVMEKKGSSEEGREASRGRRRENRRSKTKKKKVPLLRKNLRRPGREQIGNPRKSPSEEGCPS